MPAINRVGHNRLMITDGPVTSCVLHETPVVVYDREANEVTFDTGGWRTHTTIRAMNAFGKALLGRFSFEFVSLARGVLTVKIGDEIRSTNENTLTWRLRDV